MNPSLSFVIFCAQSTSALLFYITNIEESIRTMAASKILSLHGKAQKFDSRADIEPYLKDVDPTVIEEIRLGGNTIGVEASYALAEFLTRTTVLKVSIYNFSASPVDDFARSQTLRTFSPAGLYLKSLLLSPRSAMRSKTRRLLLKSISAIMRLVADLWIPWSLSSHTTGVSRS